MYVYKFVYLLLNDTIVNMYSHDLDINCQDKNYLIVAGGQIALRGLRPDSLVWLAV